MTGTQRRNKWALHTLGILISVSFMFILTLDAFAADAKKSGQNEAPILESAVAQDEKLEKIDAAQKMDEGIGEGDLGDENIPPIENTKDIKQADENIKFLSGEQKGLKVNSEDIKLDGTITYVSSELENPTNEAENKTLEENIEPNEKANKESNIAPSDTENSDTEIVAPKTFKKRWWGRPY